MNCEQPVRLGVFTTGEVPSLLQYTFRDYNGNPLDLTAGYVAKFVWAAQGGTATTGNAAITNPAGGVTEYTWIGPEFAVPGPHEAQFWVGNGTNRWASTKIVWTVQAGSGPTPAI